MENMPLNREVNFVVPKVLTRNYKLMIFLFVGMEMLVLYLLNKLDFSFSFESWGEGYLQIAGLLLPVVFVLWMYWRFKSDSTRVVLSKQGVLISKKEKNLVDEKWEDLEYASLLSEDKNKGWEFKYRSKAGWTEGLPVEYYDVRTLVEAINFYAGREMFKEDELRSYEKSRKFMFIFLLLGFVHLVVVFIVLGYVLDSEFGQ